MSNTIERTIDLKAPIEKVWSAVSDHEQFGAWFRVKLDEPFQVGKMAKGRITYPGYEHVLWEATVKRMDAPHHFAFTWTPYGVDPKRDYSSEIPTLVEFTLEPIAAGTRLTIVESGFDNVPADRRAEAFRMNSGGWTSQLENIRVHVES